MGYPTGETERGLKMMNGITSSDSDISLHLSHISPHLASPVGEVQIVLIVECQLLTCKGSNLHLPYGGDREGAEDDERNNFLRL